MLLQPLKRIPPSAGSDNGSNSHGQTSAKSPLTQTHKGNVKDWGLLGTGAAKVLGGMGILLIASLNFTNPAMALLEALARFMLKNALAGVVSMVTDGIRDIMNSFKQVDPVAKVFLDLALVVMDVVGLVGNIIATVNFVKEISMLGTVAKGLRSLSTSAVEMIKNGTKAAGPLATRNFGQLASLGFTDITGVHQLLSDGTTLATDWAKSLGTNKLGDVVSQSITSPGCSVGFPMVFIQQGISQIEQGIGPSFKTCGEWLTNLLQYGKVHNVKSSLFSFCCKELSRFLAAFGRPRRLFVSLSLNFNTDLESEKTSR